MLSLVRHLKCSLRLATHGYFRDAAALFVLAWLYYLQRLAMLVESSVMRVAHRPDKPVFILGLPRSATTAIHESLVASSGGSIQAMTCLDASIPSGTMQFLATPFMWLVRRVFAAADTPGHRVSCTHLYEEQALSGPDDMMLLVAPHLVCIPNEDLITFEPRDVDYIRLCLSRWLARPAAVASHARYVGKPLGWTTGLAAGPNPVARQFPDAQYIICLRDANACFASHMTLAYNITFHRYPHLFEGYCRIMWHRYWQGAMNGLRCLQERCQSEPSIRHTIVPFERWIASDDDRHAVLREIASRHGLGLQQPLHMYSDGKSTPLPVEAKAIVDALIAGGFEPEREWPRSANDPAAAVAADLRNLAAGVVPVLLGWFTSGAHHWDSQVRLLVAAVLAARLSTFRHLSGSVATVFSVLGLGLAMSLSVPASIGVLCAILSYHLPLRQDAGAMCWMRFLAPCAAFVAGATLAPRASSSGYTVASFLAVCFGSWAAESSRRLLAVS